jgi:DNA-binding MarR family transcriptional regulator
LEGLTPLTPEQQNLLRRLNDAAIEHPELWSLADTLAEAPLSAAQLAESSGLPPGKVRKYLRIMKEEGLIESVRTEGHRGAVEHFYSLSGQMFITTEEAEALTHGDRRRIHSFILKQGLAEAVAALVTKPSPRGLERADNPVVRFPMQVDEQGWNELVDLHHEALAKLTEAKERIAARLEEGDEERFRVTSLVMFFEAPDD